MVNYAEELRVMKQANNEAFKKDTIRAALPIGYIGGVNGMIDGIREDSRLEKERQAQNEALSEMRKKALARYEKATGKSVDDILEANGYDKDRKDDFSYGGY